MDFEIKEESNLICTDTDIEEADLEDEDGNEDDDYKEEQPRRSYVWKYFRKFDDSELCECIICNAQVGNLISNLSRHLAGAHNISRDLEAGNDTTGRGRPSRSFIWKYCTRENPKQALCHLCNKLLFFGGGNTSNIAKHLRRKHSDVLDKKEMGQMDNFNDVSNELDITSEPVSNSNNSTIETKNDRRDRKGGSYVWNYCVKLSKHTVRCKLCNKIMSFHGTANVITHLARRHNIVGNVNVSHLLLNHLELHFNIKDGQELPIEPIEDGEINSPARRGRGAIAPCSVWKYCKRLSKEVVRCGFCKKNLSFQGTSNLQRHLHRMHGIAPHSRPSFAEEANCDDSNNDIIWEHCTILDNDQAKCNMCDEVYEVDNMPKHMTVAHSIEPVRRGKRNRSSRYALNYDSSDHCETDKDFMVSNWSKDNDDDTEYIPELDDNVKKVMNLYDDMIEIDHEETNNDEDIIDPNLQLPTNMNANPLSPPSSNEGINLPNSNRNKFMVSKRMQKLQEERTRMETEYFREKAGFYRMQKYLTALQAKKVRLELERANQNEVSGVVAATYTVDATALSENITTE